MDQKNYENPLNNNEELDDMDSTRNCNPWMMQQNPWMMNPWMMQQQNPWMMQQNPWMMQSGMMQPGMMQSPMGWPMDYTGRDEDLDDNDDDYDDDNFRHHHHHKKCCYYSYPYGCGCNPCGYGYGYGCGCGYNPYWMNYGCGCCFPKPFKCCCKK